jgi:hypothetical protein
MAIIMNVDPNTEERNGQDRFRCSYPGIRLEKRNRAGCLVCIIAEYFPNACVADKLPPNLGCISDTQTM